MQEQYFQNDQINLMDYIKAIIKRKNIIVSIFIICVAATTVISFRMPKVYQIDSTVRIGSIGKILFSVAETIEKAKNRNLLESIIQEVDKNIIVDTLKQAIKIKSITDTNLLTFQIQSTKPKVAVNVLNKIESKLILEGNEFYEKNIRLVNERTQELNLRKADISKQIEILNQKISTTKIGPEYILVQDALTNYEAIYSELITTEYAFKKNLLSANNFKIIELPAVSLNPIKPNKRQMITVSAILGLILGVFIAFFVESWQNNK